MSDTRERALLSLPWLVHALTGVTAQGHRNTYCGKPESALDPTREQAILPTPLAPSAFLNYQLQGADWNEINCAVCRQVFRHAMSDVK